MTLSPLPVAPSKAMRLLGGAGLVVLALHLFGLTMTYISERAGVDTLFEYVDLDEEANIPTTFAVLLMAIASLLTWLIARSKRAAGNRHAVQWYVLATGFLVMAFDEGSRLHEYASRPVRFLLGDAATGVLFYAWIIPGAVLVVSLFVYFYRFLMSLPSGTRRGFLFAGAAFLTGAMGFEVITGWWVTEYGEENIGYQTLTTFEEILEFGGALLLVQALLNHYQDTYEAQQGPAPEVGVSG